MDNLLNTRRIIAAAMFAFCLLLGVSSTTFAQSITLDDAIQMALKNNHDTRLAMLDVEKAQEAVDIAFSNVYPSITANGKFHTFLQKPKVPFPDIGAMLTPVFKGILKDHYSLDPLKPFPAPGAGSSSLSDAMTQKNNFEASIDVQQIIFSSAVFKGIGATEIYKNTAREQLKTVVSTTIVDVKKAFYGVLLTREMLNITQESFDNARKNLKNVNAMRNQGLVSEYDALQAEVKVENIRPNIIELENKLNNAKNGLKLLMGMENAAEIDCKGSLDYNDNKIPSNNSMLTQAMKNNFQLKTLNYKKEVDQAFVEIEKSDYWPTIALFGKAGYNGLSEDFNFTTYSSALVGVSFSMNLFKGGQTFHKVQEKRIDKLQTEQKISKYKEFISMDIKTKLHELNKIKSNLDAQDRNVKLAKRAYDISTVRYKQGTGNQLEVQNADIALKQAKTNKLKSIFDYLVTNTELDNLTGNVDEQYLRPFLKVKK